MAKDYSGFPEWVYETVRTLSAEQLRTNQIVMLDTPALLAGGPWSSYVKWLDDLAARYATELRDISSSLIDWLADAEHITLIPSAHCGPYLLRLGGGRTDAERLVFGARVPAGARISSPALNRSELLIRLNALANDSRLRILELLAHSGELSTPEITERLDFSQSAGSRHLEHLAAAGYVTVRRPEVTKSYRLNGERVEDTFEMLKRFEDLD